MNKSEIIAKVAQNSGQSMEDTSGMFDAFIAVLGEALRSGDTVTISGFGTFLPSSRAEREGVHPQNPTQRIKIPPHTVPRFRPSEQLTAKMKK